jgi:hypothetical protein
MPQSPILGGMALFLAVPLRSSLFKDSSTGTVPSAVRRLRLHELCSPDSPVSHFSLVPDPHPSAVRCVRFQTHLSPLNPTTTTTPPFDSTLHLSQSSTVTSPSRITPRSNNSCLTVPSKNGLVSARHGVTHSCSDAPAASPLGGKGSRRATLDVAVSRRWVGVCKSTSGWDGPPRTEAAS